MSDNQSNNKKIAKNTLVMYFRMLFMMVISLYTSRVTLQVLGVEDFGTYNIVGGVVVLFSFISLSLQNSIQRHLSFELGKPDGDFPKVFSACLKIHIIMALIFVLLSETVGLWFLNTQMNFPKGRMTAVNIVYQFVVQITAFGVAVSPYNAAIIAYEKMSFYAYTSILSASLKLLIVYLLIVIPCDKLALYGVLQLGITIFNGLLIASFCHIKLAGVKIVRNSDKGIFRYLLSFSGWALLGSATGLAETQGLNVIINIFYGVAVNAAAGVSNQVRNAINQFVSGFQQALNPQLVMAQSSGEKERQLDLVFKSSRYSFIILFALAFPIMLNLDYLLGLWLTIVPPYTTQICILAMICQILEGLSSPLYTTIFAIGDIKKYQICVMLFRLVSIIVALIFCYAGATAYFAYTGPCFVAVLLLGYRLHFLKNKIDFPIASYSKNVLRPLLIILLVSVTVFVTYSLFIQHPLCFIEWMLVTALAFGFNTTLLWFVGMRPNERVAIINQVKQKITNKYGFNYSPHS